MTGRLTSLGALMLAAAELPAAIRRERERAVDELRELVPGVTGRLDDGGRLWVTAAELAAIREHFAPVGDAALNPYPASLAGIEIVLDPEETA